MQYILMLALVGCVVVALSAEANLDGIWANYKTTYNKQYTAEEEQFRRKVWEQNIQMIQSHNLEYDLGLQSYTMGLNHFGDWTIEEYQKYMLGARRELYPKTDSRLLFTPHSDPGALPDQVDWRDKGYVTPVKDQGKCGSCWAFSSTGALEGQHFRKSGKLVSLSEQNLVDCVSKNLGCNGGWMDNSFDYVQANNGIDTEDGYPYTAKQGACNFTKSDIGSTCSGHVDIPAGNESALQEAVATVGPIAVAVDAAHQGFMYYKSGIFYDSTCSHKSSDHAVLVVGYGQENGYDYWLVKNSWTANWGDKGYIKMARNCNNMCSIAAHASYPIV